MSPSAKRKYCGKKCGRAAWRKAHKEEIKTYNASYKEKNKEALRSYSIAYDATHRELRRANRKKQYYADPEKAKRDSAEYRSRYPEKGKAAGAAWRKNNLDRSKSVGAAWRKTNLVKARANSLAWYKANRERARATKAAWEKDNPEIVRRYYHNRQSRKSVNGGKLSKGIIQKLLILQRGKCAICKRSLKKFGFHLDHIVPLVRGGKNADSNVQLACPTCNIKKGGKDPIQFMQEQGFLL